MLTFQAILVGLWVTWAIIDEQTLQLQTTRPIITGPVVGLIMGDFMTGLIVGAMVELMFLAVVFVGTAVPPDPTLAAAIATAFAVSAGGGTELAVATALPIALIGQTISTLQYGVVNVAILHWTDKAAKKGSMSGIRRGNYIALACNLLFYGLPTFLAVNFGAAYVQPLINMIPEKIMTGLSVGGGMIGAVGFGLLLGTIKMKRLWPYFIVGYIAAAFLGINMLGIGLIAVAAVFLHNIFTSKNSDKSGSEPAAT